MTGGILEEFRSATGTGSTEKRGVPCYAERATKLGQAARPTVLFIWPAGIC